MSQTEDEVLAQAFRFDDAISAIAARFRQQGMHAEAVACSLIGTAARASLEASGAEATADRLRNAAAQVEAMAQLGTGADAAGGESPPAHPAEPLASAIADTALELHRAGVDADLIGSTALASSCALIHRAHGPDGLAARLRAFLAEIEPIAAPAKGRA